MIRARRMRAARSGALLALVVVAVSGGTGASAMSASADIRAGTTVADGPGVEVSDDGSHFGDSVAAPLFAGLGRLVPGDRPTVTLWVRNAGDIAGLLRVSGTEAWATNAEFAAAIAVSAGLEGGVADAPIELGAASGCALILRGPLLEPGETVPVLITVAFDPTAAGRTGAEQQAGLDFVVALRNPADPASDTADCASGTVVPGVPEGPDGRADGRGGRVADTGAVLAGPATAGVLALMAGLATLVLLALRERRRRRVVER